MVQTMQALAQAGGGGGIAGMLLPMILVFGVFYLLVLRPQGKQQKKREEMLRQLKKGDRVVTNGGMFGKITGIRGNVVTLEIADRVRIRLLRGQIGGLEANMVQGADEKEEESARGADPEGESKAA